MNRTIQIMALWAAIGPWAGAQLVSPNHFGSNNPAGEGFSVGGGQQSFGTNDGGILAWVINDTSTTDGRDYYASFSNADRVRLASAWHFVWNTKVLAGPDGPVFLTDFELTNSTGNQRRYNAYFSRTNNDISVRLGLAAGGSTNVTVLNAGTGFHTWELARTNAASDVAQFYFDGTFLANYSGWNDDNGQNIAFGTGPGIGVSQTEWAYFFAEVPEPSSLLVFGTVMLVGVLFRKRR